jgi:hypothetical protein
MLCPGVLCVLCRARCGGVAACYVQVCCVCCVERDAVMWQHVMSRCVVCAVCCVQRDAVV